MTQVERIMEAAALPIPQGLYRGAGRCWVAIRDGQIADLVMMGDYPEPLLQDLGRKRLTAKAMDALRDARDKAFAEHRRVSRARLAAKGEVVSGTASAHSFYPSLAERRARLAAFGQEKP